MQRTTAVTAFAALAVLALVGGRSSAAPDAAGMPFGDFAWMHGVDYTPSYAATDVETWLHYDPAVIDRELACAERIGFVEEPLDVGYFGRLSGAYEVQHPCPGVAAG